MGWHVELKCFPVGLELCLSHLGQLAAGEPSVPAGDGGHPPTVPTAQPHVGKMGIFV